MIAVKFSSRKTFFAFLLLAFISQGCHYLPFLKYRTSKGDDGFPKFREKHYFQGGDHSLRSGYDITCYDWSVDVDPKRKKLSGLMQIHFRATAATDTILLDLQAKMKVESVEGSAPIAKYFRKGDLMYIVFDATLTENGSYSVSIDYRGKPASILGNGPVFWEKDSAGFARVSTLTQGIGPHYVMPCKDLLYDEPDSCFIRLTTPNGLTGVANGKLIKVDKKEAKTTYHYAVINPINVYNISFNVAKFCQLDFPYTDAEGNDRIIEAQVLCEDSAEARIFYAQTPAVMGELEGLYGTFPWWSDGCKFVQSAISGGAMEHQSAISMGDILYMDLKSDGQISTNSTLIHELAHEWWGNSITATDYGDAWLHEGMATFSEGLVAERLYGQDVYYRMVRRGYSMNFNERPVIKPFGVRYNSWASSPDYNIYGKGALFMHTLRMQIDNDSLFFKVLKDATMYFEKSNIDTDQLETFFSSGVGRDLKPFFDVYLRQNAIPIFEVAVDETTGSFYYKWAQPMPNGFDMFIDVKFGEETIRLYPKNDWSEMKMPNKSERSVEREKSGYFDVVKTEMEAFRASLRQ